MDTSDMARVRVRSRGFRFELVEGEEFLSAAYPKLLEMLERAARVEVVIREDQK